MQIDKIEGCEKYSDNGQCEICTKATHYKIGDGRCCEYGKAWDDVKNTCVLILSNDCKKGTDLSHCTECNDRFYPEKYKTTVDNKFCCGHSTYFNPFTGRCTSILDLRNTEQRCGLWDFMYSKCLACSLGNYQSSKEVMHCCPEGFYYKDDEPEEKCVKILNDEFVSALPRADIDNIQDLKVPKYCSKV